MKPLLMLVTVGVLLAAGAQEDAKGDKQKILGTWKVVSAEDGGNRVEAGNAKVTITKDKITIKKGDETEFEAAYQLDPTKKPKWIDLTAMRGGEERKMLGIYELDGDKLKICINERSGGERSTEFVSQAGSPNDLLLVLKREKP